jgi:hypothetical protein
MKTLVQLERAPALTGRPRFTTGNNKLGKDGLIYCFNLPAPGTCCPSPVCMEVVNGDPRCYGMRNLFRMKKLKALRENNYRWAQSAEFVSAAIDEIWRLGIAVLRWHDVGDFFNPTYIEAVHRIVRETYHTVHYAYTRSMVIPKCRPALVNLAGEPNFQLSYSFDKSMEIPPCDKGIDLCYLSISDSDEPPCPVEMVWRDLAAKHTTIRTHTTNGSPICPYEDGTGRQVTCSMCQRCWSRARTGRYGHTCPRAVGKE